MRCKGTLLGLWVLAGFISLFIVSPVWAAPQLIKHEGTLTDAYGNPIPDQTVSMRFRICNAETAGKVLWMEIQQVDVKSGSYSVLLGSVFGF